MNYLDVKLLQGPIGEPGIPGNVYKDEKYPDDLYEIKIIDGQIVAVPYNKSAMRRSQLNKLLEKKSK